MKTTLYIIFILMLCSIFYCSTKAPDALESTKLFLESQERIEKLSGEINKLREANKKLLNEQITLLSLSNFAVVRDTVIYNKAVELGLIKLPVEKKQ